jgi:8-oxo-dGTP pyrophosphatase MutT (NUDIX family)
MAITSHQIGLAVEDYLAEYPHEGIRIKRLLDSIGACSNLTIRTNFEGHVTCGAVLIDTSGRVLHIHHNALDRWLLPGGHLEEGDLTLQSAALRELNEETGIPVSAVATVERFGVRPIDIDVHHIPANEAKGEPPHWHFDIRYVFQTNTRSVILQAGEVNSYRWLSLTEMPSTEISQKLASLLWPT